MKDGLLIHVGINFILIPQPPLSKRISLAFQGSLIDQGVDIAGTQYTSDGIIIACYEPVALEARISSTAPNVGQLLILGGQNPGSVDLFSQRVEAILQAYYETFPTDTRRLIASDVTLRFLYETGADHAFRQLWENRLHQSVNSLATLGGPVLGGGLRFVVPLVDKSDEPCIVEVKIESLLSDADKLYVEAIFKWELNSVPNATLDATRRLRLVDEYVDQKVGAFMDWEETNNDAHDRSS